MALIVPTVETIGDEMLTNSLVEKTCEELQDTAVSDIGYHAFYDNKVIKKVVFGAAVSLGGESFRGCTALSAADFHKLTSIKTNEFYGCSSLETLIIRTPSVCSMYSAVSLNKTPIANGTGYIYVPSALVDSYKTTTPWNTYANQIRAIEDYPEICDPV